MIKARLRRRRSLKKRTKSHRSEEGFQNGGKMDDKKRGGSTLKEAFTNGRDFNRHLAALLFYFAISNFWIR